MAELRLAYLRALRTREGQTEEFLVCNNAPLSIRTGEVVCLAGTNQSGKSTIVGTLAGSHSAQSDTGRLAQLMRGEIVKEDGIEVDHQMLIDSRAYSPRSVSDAAREGVVAVYQDDRLIKTMTVEEQYALRHCRQSLFGALGKMAVEKAAYYLKRWSKQLPETWEIERKILAKTKTITSKGRAREDLRKEAKDLLLRFDSPGGESFSTILDKFPDQLSGGARAIAKVVGALLNRNLRFLILDEAFSGVDPEVWQRAIDTICRIAAEQEVGILVVSHVEPEISYWSPARIYRIIGKRILLEREISGATFVLQSPIRSDRQFGVFVVNPEEPKASYEFLSQFKAPWVVVCDQSVEALKPSRELVGAIKGPPPHRVAIFQKSISISGDMKTPLSAWMLLNFYCEHIRNERATIVIIGGGTLLNLAGFASSIFLRGRVPTIYVPTTPTAIADVAIGSKTGVNFDGDDGSGAKSPPKKHVFGTYFDPSGIVIDKRYMNGFSASEKWSALAEIIKHGIVQDVDVFTECVRLLSAPDPAGEEIVELAIRVARLKQEVILTDLDERSIGRILQYGHLHAHSLERAMQFSVSHDKAVWVGLYHDLVLGGGNAVWNGTPVSDIILKNVQREFRGLTLPSNDDLREAYGAETKIEAIKEPTKFSVLKVSKIGEFGSLERSVLQEADITWGDISASWNRLRDYLLIV